MAYTFLPGYNGVITIPSPSYSFGMAAWEFGFRVEKLPFDTFNKVASVGLYFKNFLAGLASGDVVIRGYWDNTTAQMPSGPTLLIRPGQSTTIFLGYTTSVGYTLTGFVDEINPKADAGKSCDFDFKYTMLTVSAYTGQT